MIIENPDALKLWLTTKLGPLCDADPAALAKYVFALVKKDKPTVELRDSMIEQLEVFLQKETANFVELLLLTLEGKSYLPASSAEVKTEVKAEEVAVNHAETSNGVLPNKIPQRKSESDKEDRMLRRPRHRLSPSPPPRGRSRSRSRSWDRSRRSRSRERLRRRKTPPRRRDRRSWSRSKSPVRRSRSRSRTPIRHRRVYRSTSRSPLHDTLKKVAPNSGGATPTQDSNHGDVDMRLATTSQSIQSVISAPNNNNNNNTEQPPAMYKRRCRDFDEKGYCMRGDLCPYDHGSDPVVLEDMPLSSLGFPAGQPPGPMVPVTPAIPGTVVPVRPPPPPPLVQPLIMPEYSPDAPSMGSRVGWFRPGFRGHGRGSRGGMPPRPPHMYVPPQRELISVPVSDNAVAPPDNFSEQPEQMDFNQHEGPPPVKKSSMMTQQQQQQQQQQQHFDFSRLGPRKNPANCSLELKKVPRGLNNITHLNNHFSRFGKIVNIQVSYEGDPEAAIVTFSSHAEANAAYRSTEAVLNNRFIKVFWHNKKPLTNDGKQENVPPPSRLTIRDRLGVAPHSSKVLNLVQPRAVSLQSVVTIPNTTVIEPATQEDTVEEKVEKVIMSGNNLTKTVYIPTALKKQPDPALQENSKALATAAILKSQEILAAKETLKKKQEEKRKEAIKLTVNLRKRKQELLEMQLSQQKLLIERLEKGKGTEQKALMTTIKGLQESIEKIRKDLAPQQPAPPPPRKTKEEALKEILDAELDLFTRQQEGRESAELKKRVAELKLEAHSLGLLTPAGSVSRGRGSARGRSSRGSFRGRGGRGAHAHTSVDHRPTRLLVSGHESDEWKDVLAHFAQFGEISDYTMDPQTPSLDLMFKTRKDAEAALIQGRNFRDRVLTVTWSLGHVVTPVAAVTPRSNKQQHEEMQEEDEEDGETELIYEGDEELEIEEEEDDLEERSWRR